MEPEPEPAPVEPPTTDELLAAAVSDPERLAQLLDHASANIDAVDDLGYAALHLAVWQGKLAAVETLLEYGADVEATTWTHKRPLYLAVEAGNTEIVLALLVHGAVPDADVQGLTALHEAVRRGEAEAARLLLDYGADVNATTYDLREPLFLAVLSRKANVITLLLDRGADPDSFFTEDPPTALHLAAHYGDVDVMEALLDGGANVDPRDFEGATPLFRAVASGHLDAVELLLQRGANTRTWRIDGRTALDLAEGNDDMRGLLEAETVWKGPRIGGDDNEAPEEQPEQPFRVLKPSPPPPETDRHKNVACHGFEAIVVDFYTSGTEEEMVPKTPSVYELLYSQGPEAFRSTLQGKTPDFTWYHLPANNLVWAETLVRRIAAEKGGISTEMYDEARADLDLARHNMPRVRHPQNVPARLSTLRPQSRRVTGPSPISVDGIGDGIVSFVPFLHYDTYTGYSKMANTMDEVAKGKPAKTKKKQTKNTVLVRATIQSQRGSGASQRNRPGTDGSSLPSSSFVSPDVVLDWRTRARLAFQAARAQLSGWLGRKPAFPEESVLTNTDLEGQPEQAVSAENETSGNRQGQAAGNTSVRSIGTRVEATSAPVSEKSIAPEDVSLPPSRQSSTRQGSTHPNEQQTAAERGQEGNVPDNDRNLPYEPAQGSHFETRSRSSRRAPTIPPPKRMERRRTAPPDQNLNEHLIRGYYLPWGIAYQPRRTLDQYGYAGIETTSHRDDDQVVYRYTESELHGDAKIFMVDQLWMWVLGNDTIITCSPLRWNSWTAKSIRPTGAAPHIPRPTLLQFFGGQGPRPPPRMHPAMAIRGGPPAAKKARSNQPPRKERPFQPESTMWPELRQNDPLNVAQQVTRYLSKRGRGAVTSVHDLASVVTTCCVDVFDPHQTPEDYLFFDFFERSIGRANDLVANYLRKFKNAISEMGDGQKDIEWKITDETTLMIEVEDILDELHTLKKVLEDQERVISDLNKVLESFAPEGKKPAEVEMRTLKTHLSRIAQMEKAARKADDSLSRLMDLKQKQASLAEASWARDSAKDTARQGKTVIVFTVVTIIFLPISFIAAVFSIDTNGFPLDTSEKIPFDYVMKYILTIGLALSIPLIIIAFNVDRIAELIYELRKYHTILWKKGTLGAVVIGIFAAILVPLWTSELSHSGKVATTVIVFLLALGAAIAYLIRLLVKKATRGFDVTTMSSDTTSE